MRRGIPFLLALVLVLPVSPALEERTVNVHERAASLYVPAVSQNDDGTQIGALSVLTLTLRSPGRGEVFVRTEPLAELDLQGAARLAVDAAAELTGQDARAHDYFFTLTTASSVIGGPSSGGAMAVAAVAVLQDWDLDPTTAMTGMINPDLSIGPVGGIAEKAEVVASVGVNTFLVPRGQATQYDDVATTDDQGNVVIRREAVDIAEKAKREWNLDIIEIDDLYDAIPRFTGRTFPRPANAGDPTRDAYYEALMEDASQRQMDNATSQDAQARDIQSRVAPPTDDRQTVEAQLATSSDLLAQAATARGNGRHYQASSFAFQSLVQTRHALAILSYYSAPGDIEGYTRSYVASVATDLASANDETGLPFPWTANQFGAQGAVEARMAEAEQRLNVAHEALDGSRWGVALEHASFARERIGSALWWATVRDRVASLGPPANVTAAGLSELASEYAGAARLMVAYAATVLGEAGADTSRVAAAQEELDSAEFALDTDQFSAGVFGLLRAMSQVNAAMAGLSPDGVTPERLDALRSRAAYEIAAARAVGVEPVFAVSQFEFAESRAATDPVDAYESYTFARMAAKVTIEAGGTTPSPTPWDVLPGAAGPPSQRLLTGAAWAWLAVAALPGAAAALVAATLAPPTKPRPPGH